MDARDVLKMDVLAGATGGLAAVCAGHPLDTVKVNMQLFPKMYNSIFGGLSKTVRWHGLRGIYAGISPAIASTCVENAIVFAAYGQSQRAVASVAGVDDTTRLSCLQNAAAGSITSLFTSTLICPMELVKIRMQATVPKASVGNVMRDVCKKHGLRGFYRGISAMLAREFVGNAVFFGVYEWSRERLRPRDGRKEDCTAVATASAGAVAGGCSCMTVYPADVIKSHAQMPDVAGRSGGLRLILDDVRREGGSFRVAVYRGLRPTLLKAMLVAGATLYAVEFSKLVYRRELANLKDGREPAWLSGARSWLSGARSWLSDAFDSYRQQISACEFKSGCVAGIVSTFVGHPKNTIRTVQQVTDTKLEKAARDVYLQDKFKGYRGMTFSVLSAGVINAVCFGVHGNTKRLIHAFRIDGTDGGDQKDVRFCCDTKNLNRYWHLDVFTSGCVAGVFVTAINIPIEVVKTKLQLTNVPVTPTPGQTYEVPKILSPMKLIAELYKTNGLRSMYRGGMLFLIRNVPSMGVYMVAYEHLCYKLKGLWNFGETAEVDPTHQTQSIPKIVQVISGGLAGVISWVIVLPIDMIKSKILADDPAKPKYKGAWDCALKTYRQGGAKRFFRGFWPLCLGTFIVNGIIFVTYETLLKTCLRHDGENPVK